jgi:hypothetical protein
MIGGKYSVGELHDLVIAKDSELKSLEDAWRGFDPSWLTIARAADDQWMNDLNALKARYGRARDSAQQAIDAAKKSGKADNTVVADGQYRAILSALQVQSGLVSPGDLQDLWNRLQSAIDAHAAASGAQAAPIAEAPVWQPVKGSDVDENQLKMADASVAGAVAVAMANAGLIRDASNPQTPPPPPAKGPGVFTWLLVGGGATLLGIAGVKIAWKVAKPF